MERDPKELSDEELDKAIEAPEVAEPEPPEAPADPEVETPPEAPAEDPPVEEPKPSRRENLRIQQILEKAKRGEYTNPNQPKGLDYGTDLEADPEVVKRLEQDRRVVSDEAYRQGVKQAEVIGWETMLRLENPTVEREYAFLNKNDSQNFNPAAANAMNSKYLRFVGYEPGDASKGIAPSVAHPNVSYLEFVAAEMEFADEIASHKVAESSKNIAKQAATTGLRPDGSQAKRLNLNKAPEQMSDEELDAIIGQAIPQK